MQVSSFSSVPNSFRTLDQFKIATINVKTTKLTVGSPRILKTSKISVKVVPAPISDLNSIVPPRPSTMRFVM